MTEYAEYTQREREIYDTGFAEGRASGATASLQTTYNMLKEIDSRFEKVGDESLTEWRERFVEIIRQLLD